MQMFITRGLGMNSSYADTVVVDSIIGNIDNRDSIKVSIDSKNNYNVNTREEAPRRSIISKKGKHKVSIRTKGIL